MQYTRTMQYTRAMQYMRAMQDPDTYPLRKIY